MINNKLISLAVLSSLALTTPAFAQTQVKASLSSELHGNFGGVIRNVMEHLKSSIIGTVSSINGTVLTVTSNKVGWGRDGKNEDAPKATPTPVTYTVDASNAVVVKAGVASTVSNIAVGDTVMVQGTITGTNVVATNIRDGAPKPTRSPKPEPTPLIQGNGQPVVAGSITAIGGTSITVTNKSNVTYTIDASNAKIVNKGGLSTLSTLAVGDNVVVQGAVNGTAVTAYSVIDQQAKADAKTKPPLKFFGGIGHFFQRLFGF